MVRKCLKIIIVLLVLAIPLYEVRYLDFNQEPYWFQLLSWLCICFFYGWGIGSFFVTISKKNGKT